MSVTLFIVLVFLFCFVCLLPGPGWVAEKEILVSLREHRVVAIENGAEKFRFGCILGEGSNPTRPGQFVFYHKHENYLSPAANRDIPYTVLFSKDGRAIHGAICCVPIESCTRSLREEFGAPGGEMHACVRLSVEDARKLFAWTGIGTRVSIVDQ